MSKHLILGAFEEFTPNFIGNRLAFGTGAFALDYILKNDLTIEEVDMVTGPIIGRPKTATFRLIDLVGIDVWDHVGRNLAPLIQHDKYALPYLAAEAPNALIAEMIKRGWLGNKTRGGFYNVKKEILKVAKRRLPRPKIIKRKGATQGV